MMRRLLALGAAVLLWPALAGAQAISIGQTTLVFGGSAVFSDGTEVFTFAGNPAANSLVCAVAGLSNGSVITSVTGLGGSWSTPVTFTDGSGDVSTSCSCNPAGAAAAVTVNVGGSDSSANIRGYVINMTQSGGSGFDCSNIRTNHGIATSTAHPSGSVTPGAANNVMLGLLKGASGTYTNEAGWTAIALVDASRGIAGYLIQTAATAGGYDPTTSTSIAGHAIVVEVDSTGGGGGSTAAKNCTLVGVCE